MNNRVEFPGLGIGVEKLAAEGKLVADPAC